MRIRTVKPEFWSSLDVAALSRDARLLFIGLWNYVDDEGRGYADARLLKAQIFPMDDDIDSSSVRRMLDELSSGGQIVLYEHCSKPVLAVVAFSAHQKIDRPRPSKFLPPPTTTDTAADTIPPGQPNSEPSANVRRGFDEPSFVARRDLVAGREGKGREGKGREGIKPSDASGDASGAPESSRRNPDWDAAIAALEGGLRPHVTGLIPGGWVTEFARLATKTRADPARLAGLLATVLWLDGHRDLTQVAPPTRGALLADVGHLVVLAEGVDIDTVKARARRLRELDKGWRTTGWARAFVTEWHRTDPNAAPAGVPVSPAAARAEAQTVAASIVTKISQHGAAKVVAHLTEAEGQILRSAGGTSWARTATAPELARRLEQFAAQHLTALTQEPIPA